jgi:hypothetical protein
MLERKVERDIGTECNLTFRFDLYRVKTPKIYRTIAKIVWVLFHIMIDKENGKGVRTAPIFTLYFPLPALSSLAVTLTEPII